MNLTLPILSFLAMAGAALSSAQAIEPIQESLVECEEGNATPLKCTFQETWTYDYGANMLDIIEDTAQFSKAHVQKACEERNMRFGRNANTEGTGGISHFTIEHEDRRGSVSAKMNGTFFCISK